MKKTLAILLFIVDILLGPIAIVLMGVYVFIRFTFFNSIRMHWYDGLVITKDYYMYVINNFKTLYYNSYEVMIKRLRV